MIGIIIHNQTADDNVKYKNRLHRNTLDREKTDTDRQTDRHRQTDKKQGENRQTDRQMDRQTGRPGSKRDRRTWAAMYTGSDSSSAQFNKHKVLSCNSCLTVTQRAFDNFRH